MKVTCPELVRDRQRENLIDLRGASITRRIHFGWNSRLCLCSRRQLTVLIFFYYTSKKEFQQIPTIANRLNVWTVGNSAF